VLAPVKHTTSVAYEPIQPGSYDDLTNPPRKTRVIDQARAGLTTPGAFLKLEPHLFRLFAAAPDALDRVVSATDLASACTACGGSGRIRHDMGFMPPVLQKCETCNATGWRTDLLDLKCGKATLGELATMTLAEIADHFAGDEGVAKSVGPALDLGLGYLTLRQPRDTLSGGEAQRLKITAELRRPRADLYILDEPTIGQHLEDVGRLVAVLRSLVEAGRSVLVIEHHPQLLACCDWLVELGPGAANSGGLIVAQGTPEHIASRKTATAPYIRSVLEEA
jgi:excinuclease ABC subunit A